MNWYLDGWKNAVNFEGRSRRSAYWMFYLLNVIVFVALTVVSKALGNVYNLVSILPLIALGIRRMHDVGRSGWYILIPFYNIVLLCTDGDAEENAYGPNPKSGAAE